MKVFEVSVLLDMKLSITYSSISLLEILARVGRLGSEIDTRLLSARITLWRVCSSRNSDNLHLMETTSPVFKEGASKTVLWTTVNCSQLNFDLNGRTKKLVRSNITDCSSRKSFRHFHTTSSSCTKRSVCSVLMADNSEFSMESSRAQRRMNTSPASIREGIIHDERQL